MPRTYKSDSIFDLAPEQLGDERARILCIPGTINSHELIARSLEFERFVKGVDDQCQPRVPFQLVLRADWKSIRKIGKRAGRIM